MGEDVGREGLDVLRGDEVTAAGQGAGLERRHRHHQGAGGDSLGDLGVGPDLPGNVHQAGQDLWCRVDLVFEDVAGLQDLGPAHPGEAGARRLPALEARAQHLDLRLAVDVLHANLEEEAVELGDG